MCQPSPRGRCPKDAMKVVEAKTAALVKEVEAAKTAEAEPKPKTKAEKHSAAVETYKREEKIKKLAEEVAEAKAFLYATPTGQAKPFPTAMDIKNREIGLSPEVKKILEAGNADSKRTGAMLAKFQTVAKLYAKENPDNNVETARLMANGVFANTRGQMHSALVESYKKSLVKTLAASPEDQHGKIKLTMAAQHRADVKRLDKAFSYATEDAMDAVEKDRVKNSQTFENSIDKHKFGFYKNTDGSFTVRTRFDVEAKNLEEAVTKAENSFKLEDVQLTVGQPKNGVYTVDTAYVYKGGEKLEDAQKFQKEVWNGTPRWRQTLDQVRQLDNFYDEENQQGRYAPGFRPYK